MTLKDIVRGRKGEGDMAVVLEEELYEQAVKVVSSLDRPSIPPVDPDSAELDDLFAWGDAVARLANLTEERSRELLRAVRKHIRSRS